MNCVWIHDYVKVIHESVFKKVTSTIALLPQETWDRYVLLEITGLAEQTLLDKALKSFHELWNATYPYRIKKNVQSQGTESIVGGVSHQRKLTPVPNTEGSD